MNTTRRWGRIVLWCTLVILTALVFTSNSAQAQSVSLENLLSHIKVGWTKLALEEAAHVLTSGNSTDPELLALSGLILSTGERWDLARQAYLKTIETGKLSLQEQGAFYTLVGKTYLAETSYQLAKKYYLEALNISEEVGSLVDLGLISLRLGEFSAAEEYLSRAEEMDRTGYPKLYRVRGELANALGDQRKAIEYYKEALKYDPREIWIYQEMRAIYQELGDGEAEKKLLEEAKSMGIELDK